MNPCPQCANSEIGEADNFCRICGLALKGEAATGMTADIKKDGPYPKQRPTGW